MVGGLEQRVASENQSSIAFVALVANAQPIRFVADLSLATINRSAVDNQRGTALTSNESPGRRFEFAIVLSDFFYRREI